MSKNFLAALAACFSPFLVLLAQSRNPATPNPDAHTPRVRQSYVGDSLDVVPLTTLQAWQAANRVVYVQSKGSEVKPGPGGNLFTYTTFRVLDALKGAAESDLQMRIFGGRLGDVSVSSLVDIDFTAGDKFILFLGENNRDGYPTIIPQALFAVKVLDGVEVVEPSPTGLQLYHARGGRAYSEAGARHVSGADFLFSLRRAK